MKFRIFNEEAKYQEVFFRLREDGDNITLIACDSTGERLHGGTILSIQPEGFIYLHTFVSEYLGLQFDGTHVRVEHD